MANVVKSAVRAFIEAAYGGPTTEQEKNVVLSAGPIVGELVPNNAERVSLTFVNVGGNDCSVGFGPLLATGGIRLVASGGTVNMEVRDDASLPAHQWFGSSTAGTTVYVLEVIRSIYTPPDELQIKAPL